MRSPRSLDGAARLTVCLDSASNLDLNSARYNVDFECPLGSVVERLFSRYLRKCMKITLMSTCTHFMGSANPSLLLTIGSNSAILSSMEIRRAQALYHIACEGHKPLVRTDLPEIESKSKGFARPRAGRTTSILRSALSIIRGHLGRIVSALRRSSTSPSWPTVDVLASLAITWTEAPQSYFSA